jgi:DNA-binding transcriptional regulator LsrR (DeoR family)
MVKPIGPKAEEMAHLKARVAKMLQQHLEPRIISQRLGLKPEKTSRLIRAVKEEGLQP